MVKGRGNLVIFTIIDSIIPCARNTKYNNTLLDQNIPKQMIVSLPLTCKTKDKIVLYGVLAESNVAIKK